MIEKFELSHTDNFLRSINIAFISKLKHEKDWKSFLHSHEFTEFFYIKSGNGFMRIENKDIPICKDTFIIINPLIEHTEISSPDNPLECLVIGAYCINIIENKNTSYSFIKFGTSDNPILRCFENILFEMEHAADNHLNICQNYFELMILYLCRKDNISYKIDDSKKINKECNKLKEYIDSNYSEKINLDNLAKISNLNKYYLSHRFSAMYGTSPISYLNKVRIEACKDLLRTTNHSIDDIANMTGFSSRSYMAQVFLKMCNTTAQKYRKEKKR